MFQRASESTLLISSGSWTPKGIVMPLTEPSPKQAMNQRAPGRVARCRALAY
ncbi:Uncharacterised protein [Mycobacteroides abscessus subsp. abscessus]|nr:Uncharacterised protein [Mycobacteroides abscessus subsp. abscessus]